MRIDIRPPTTAQLSNLTATSHPLRIVLSWDVPTTDPDYRAAQVFVSTVNDFETATLYNTVASNQVEFPTLDTAIRYFWVRSVNQYGRADGQITGPVSATAGKIMTSHIGVFDLATANIVNALSVSNITGLGALATISKVDAYTQVTNLGGLAFASAIYADEIGAGTLASGVVYAGVVNAGQVNAGVLNGIAITAGSGGTPSSRALEITSGGVVYVDNVFGGFGRFTNYANTGADALVATSAGGGAAITANGNLVTRDVVPGSGNAWNCGTSSSPWANVFTQSAPVVTSDERSKSDLTVADLGLGFINDLEPVKYRIKEKRIVTDDPNFMGPVPPNKVREKVEEKVGSRFHYGLKAQQVRKAMLKNGVKDAAFWIMTDPNDPESMQALRYEELVAPMIKAIQELSAEVTALKQQLEVDKTK